MTETSFLSVIAAIVAATLISIMAFRVVAN